MKGTTETSPASELPLVVHQQSIREAIEEIDRHAKGIVLVVDEDRRLVATVTDGDVRRAMLAGLALDQSVAELLDARARDLPPRTASEGASVASLVAQMRAASIWQIPLVDESGRVTGLVALEDLVSSDESPLSAVVMAGGFGRRLAPLTDETPKPMLPVGDRPLLEHIVEQLREAGISQVNMTTHYRGEAIAEHFGDGRGFGVEIEYVPEEEPLGTAGALGLLDAQGPLLVMNADLVTRIDFRALRRFHAEHDAAMTVAVRPYDVTVPFGLVRLDREAVVGIDEKPLLRGFVNAGIYLVNPEVCRLVGRGERLDMPELITRLVDNGSRVVGFPLREYWLDVGRLEDYEQARAQFAGTGESPQ